MELKESLGVAASFLVIIAYLPYLRNILKNKTKPHTFSWLIWGTNTGIGFFGQMAGNAGPGAWATGFSALICILIFLLGIKKGHKDIAPLDWVSLAGAVLAIGIWYFTKEPLFSIILVAFIDSFGFIPTIRKSITNPFEETASTYALCGLTFFLALFALNEYTIVSALYPVTLVAVNWGFTIILVVKRKQLLAKTLS